MRSLPDDRTARAKIRDEALRLFAERGPDAVTVRDIAAAAGVSAALVIRHYKSKDGLREAVDAHVADVFEAMLTRVVREEGDSSALDPTRLPSLAEAMAEFLPADSPVPGYLGRLLLAPGSVGTALFRRLHTASKDALATLVQAGAADAGADPEVRAAVLLVNDLAVLMLRHQLREVLGVDPLSGDGLERWAGETLSIYRTGLSGGPDHT
ncbi:TetR/AcrR family transcriptional regulator [Streptomyces cacaoi]|uniref:Putative transcriptional regulator, TetR family protein n=1 Tax=Streptomyces cacaoi TaxID=1898 RepID=A0A4Y3R0T5_STRCI|nr:TetR/AcrR family transcriptional regulator [Streptomyces cacaoi]NNG87807.1 TetR/AcrR family transcriptional regulator [Streptomyces cacaoi]GEB49730.1 putative transcriptional regulator, TetR family protein [Streptomyces cacaoi]